ncbi:MFS general substrate transporter [Colletotrichum sublineola]|nr:MFS general substrate transporter [Colletotrichum sublineola]
MATVTTTVTSEFDMTTYSPAATATTPVARPLSSEKAPGPSRTVSVADVEPQDAQLATQSLWATTLLITTLCGVTFASSMTTGLLAVALPTMARELDIADGLLLWPASIYGLTCGCSLLIAGSVADIVGSRRVYIAGCFLLTGFVLGSGLAQNFTQLVVFRAGQGIAASMCLPTAISLLASSLPVGKRRNVGFAFAGASQPLGYSIGLFLGGFFVDSVGWRCGWYMSAAASFVVFLAAVFGIPTRAGGRSLSGSVWKRLAWDIDWVGAVLASACFGMLSYVLAVISDDSQRIKHTTQIVLLCVAGGCLPSFILWVQHQEKHGKPALIPNSLWKELAFSSICVMVFLTWAIVHSLEYLFSLFFQEVQGLSAIETSVRFIPNIAIGIVQTLAVGLVLHRTSVYWVVFVACLLTALSPLLMALNNPASSYWYAAFWAVLLSPISGDILFVVSALVITGSFPDNTHALAGAVFNTLSQFGASVGLAAVSLISSTVSRQSHAPADLVQGYRACFWTLLGAAAFTCMTGAFGLRRVSDKGMKKE